MDRFTEMEEKRVSVLAQNFSILSKSHTMRHVGAKITAVLALLSFAVVATLPDLSVAVAQPYNPGGGGGSLLPTDGSDITVKPSVPGTGQRRLGDMRTDVVYLSDFLDSTGALVDGTGVRDATHALNSALATGKKVLVTSGRYRLDLPSTEVCPTIKVGQSLEGVGVSYIPAAGVAISSSMFLTTTAFNFATPCQGLITGTFTLDGSVSISDLGFHFYEPAFYGMTRADVPTYPAAIRASSAAMRIRNIRVEGGTSCIDARGSGGGAQFIENIDCGSIGVGYAVGSMPPSTDTGAKDTVHVINWHQWPFGNSAGSGTCTAAAPAGCWYQDVYSDGQNVCMDIGDVEPLIATNIACFRAGLRLNDDAVHGWFQFSNLAMDGAWTDVSNAIFLEIQGFYTSFGRGLQPRFYTGRPAIHLGGGPIHVVNGRIQGSPQAPALVNDGASLTWVGGFITSNNALNYVDGTAWHTNTQYYSGKSTFNPGSGNTYLQTVNRCTSSTTGTGPAGTGSGITDGDCKWNFIAVGDTATKTWATSKPYIANEWVYVTASNRMYGQTAASCVSASSGTGPSGTGTGIVDGTCLWNSGVPAFQSHVNAVCPVVTSGTNDGIRSNFTSVVMRPPDSSYFPNGYICQQDKAQLELIADTWGVVTAVGTAISIGSDTAGNLLVGNYTNNMTLSLPTDINSRPLGKLQLL